MNNQKVFEDENEKNTNSSEHGRDEDENKTSKKMNTSGNPAHKIPPYSSWYTPTQIHSIEQRSFPPPNTNLYCQYRDQLVKLYRAQPNTYLSITQCRRQLGGDVSFVARVHAFLEQWGLINFECIGNVPEKIDSLHLYNTNGGATEGEEGERPTIDKIKIHQSCINHAKHNQSNLAAVQQQQQQQEEGGEGEEAKETSKSSPSSLYNQIYCSKCQIHCPTLYYAREIVSKGDGVEDNPPAAALYQVLCKQCYQHLQQLQEDKTEIVSEFIQIDTSAFPAQAPAPTAWTPEEDLLLLEAIEKGNLDGRDDDWDTVAQAVCEGGRGKRSKEECIYRFITMPAGGEEEASFDLMEMDEDAPCVPFANEDNPLVCLLAFLAASSTPSTAAALASSFLGHKDAADSRDNDQSKIIQASLRKLSQNAQSLHNATAKQTPTLQATILTLHQRKLDQKLAILQALEDASVREKKDLEEQRLQLFFDRFNLRKQMLGIDDSDAFRDVADGEGEGDGEGDNRVGNVEQQDDNASKIPKLQ